VQDVAGPTGGPALAADSPDGARLWTNWARTVTAFPAAVHLPAGRNAIVEVIREVADHGSRLKVVGAGHSPSGIAAPDPGTHLMSLSRHSRVLDLDVSRDEVTVEAGIRLDALVGFLATRGWALPTLGSVAAQTVAGALSTGSHGSGEGAVDRHVSALELIDATGDVHRLTPREDDPDHAPTADDSAVAPTADDSAVAANAPSAFDGARTALGALGVISTATLRVVPAFTLCATMTAMSLEQGMAELPTMAGAERARLWWYPHTDRVVLWRAYRSAEAPRPASGLRTAADRLATGAHEAGLWAADVLPPLLPLVNRLAATRLLGSRRTVIDTGDRVLTRPEGIRRQVLEYAVPAAAAAGVLGELRRVLRRPGLRAPAPVELRFGPAEVGWLNPSFGRPSCWIGVVGYRPFGQPSDCAAWFAAAGAVLADADGRPHWAAPHAHDAADLSGRYPRWSDFAALRQQLDPAGLFANAYLDRVLGPVGRAR